MLCLSVWNKGSWGKGCLLPKGMKKMVWSPFLFPPQHRKAQSIHFCIQEDNPLGWKNSRYWYWKEGWAINEQLFKNNIPQNNNLINRLLFFLMTKSFGAPLMLFSWSRYLHEKYYFNFFFIKFHLWFVFFFELLYFNKILKI